MNGLIVKNVLKWQAKLSICKKRFCIFDAFTDHYMHIIKESEVGEAITPGISLKADWDPAEQRMLSKTDGLWYELLSKY